MFKSILLVLIFSGLAMAEEKPEKPAIEKAEPVIEYAFHGKTGDPNRFFEAQRKELKLPGGIQVRVSTEATKGHTTAWSDLKLWSKCKNEKSYSERLSEKVCGLTHLEYETKTKELTLHLVDYDPGSLEGHCTGESYTRKIEVCASK